MRVLARLGGVPRFGDTASDVGYLFPVSSLRRRVPFVVGEDEVSPAGIGAGAGIGGASDDRRLLLMFSISTLRYGSGSFGFIWSSSSFTGEEGFEAVVNVICGALLEAAGASSTSVISTSGTSVVLSIGILALAVCST